MLGDVTTPERMDVVSSQGYAWGYIGSCVPFVVCLALVLGSGAIGLSQMTALSVALLITAVWWLGTTLPLLRNYKQINYVEVEQHAIRQSFVRIGHTLKHLREDKQVFWFLLAFFCYIDGVYTIIDMATAYGTALGLDTGTAAPAALPAAKHIFTHIEWLMSGVQLHVPVQSAPAGYVWASREQLRTTYTLPGAFRAYKPLLL